MCSWLAARVTSGHPATPGPFAPPPAHLLHLRREPHGNEGGGWGVVRVPRFICCHFLNTSLTLCHGQVERCQG